MGVRVSRPRRLRRCLRWRTSCGRDVVVLSRLFPRLRRRRAGDCRCRREGRARPGNVHPPPPRAPRGVVLRSVYNGVECVAVFFFSMAGWGSVSQCSIDGLRARVDVPGIESLGDVLTVLRDGSSTDWGAVISVPRSKLQRPVFETGLSVL